MAIVNFISNVWTARIWQNLQAALIFGQSNIVNRDYEGDIRQRGDTVSIGMLGDVTVKSYVKNTDMDAPETLSDDAQTLVIDQADYFNFQVDDIDARQAAIGLVDAATKRAGRSLAAGSDTFLSAAMALAGTPVVTSETVAYDQLVDMSVALDDTETPAEDRFAIVPPWFHGLLLKDARFVASGAAAADGRLINGKIGEAAGFTIVKSTRVPFASGTGHTIIAGHPMATSYAEQINKVEAYRLEKRFADGVKGLHLYGGKVVRPEQLATLELVKP